MAAALGNIRLPDPPQSQLALDRVVAVPSPFKRGRLAASSAVAPPAAAVCCPALTKFPEELLFLVLDKLSGDPVDVKSFAVTCHAFYAAESRHRRLLRPLREGFLPAALARYPVAEKLEFTLCRRVGDAALSAVAAAPLSLTLRAVDLSRSRSFTADGIEALAAGCPGLKELDLSNAVSIGDAAAAALGQHARKLERLWLARCRTMTDMGLGCIAVGCAELKLLSLKWCVGMTDLGFGLVAVKCWKLQTLDLSFTTITKKSLPAVAQLPEIEHLILSGCVGVDDEALVGIKSGSISIKVLDLSICLTVTRVGVSSVLSALPGLCKLNAAYCSPLADPLADTVPRVCMLQSVRLDGCLITLQSLRMLANSSIPLRELSLSKCSGVTDEGLCLMLSQNKLLEKLDITCCLFVTDISLMCIAATCTSLISLRMESCTSVTSRGFCLIGQRSPLLEELDLTDNDVDDNVLKAIAGCCHELRSLKIGLCMKITDEGLTAIGESCRKLEDVDLYRSPGVGDKGVAEIARGCPLLRCINLSYCEMITDDALRSLSSCSMLSTIEIRSCSRITSDGIKAVAFGCRRLAKLDVKKCFNVDDAAMLQLARYSRNLRHVNMSYCAVTDVGLLTLGSKSLLQSVDVVHVAGLTPGGLAAALMVCVGLTRVKLHLSFRAVLAKAVVERVESRGCMLRWVDKPFRLELEPSSDVWKQQSHEALVPL